MTSPDPRQQREVEIGPLHEAATKQPDNGGFPVDHSREAPGITALHRRGFTAEFIVDGEELRVAGGDRRFRAEDVAIRDYYRFEGTSDPDDMSIIYALEAPDGTRGTLTDAYGAYASAAVGAVVDRMCVAPLAPAGRPWRHVMIPAALGALGVVAVAVAWRRAA